MRPNEAETAVHGCHSSGDMAVPMSKVLASPWVGVRVSLAFIVVVLPYLDLRWISRLFGYRQ